MGVTNSNKTVSTDRIDCDGFLKVTLSLTATPEIISNPTDIVLVLDRSGSMMGEPLAAMKEGAKTFIDIIEEATDGTQDGVIGSGSRIGLVSFATTAVANEPLTTSVAALKDAVDSLNAGGNTNHADAFSTAMGLFDPASSNAKVMVMFTDGKTTVGPPAAPVAAAARAEGIIIYCIGLVGSDGIDVATLNNWATDPDTSHVAVTPDAADLEEIFAELAANISKPGATDVVIRDVISDDFIITGALSPSKGSAMLLDSNTIEWRIPQLGVMGSEGATLEFFVRHTAQTSGLKAVNKSISYQDNEGNLVIFPDPKVTVSCQVIVHPESCPKPVDVTVKGCDDGPVVNLGEVSLESQGRILQLNVTLKKVCPGRRVAMAVILTEVDADGKEAQRGMKTMTIPAHDSPTCRDVQVRCIKFVVPEDLRAGGDSLCPPRQFKVRVIAHNIDTDYRCCESSITF